MDGHRFDEISRVLASLSRRRMLRGLAGGVLAALPAGLGIEQAAARCGRVGEGCRKRRDCCRGEVCRRRRCTCEAEEDACGGKCCADCFLDSDPAKEFCCPAAKVCPTAEFGEICCYPDEACRGDVCCCDGCQGTVVCRGTCCPAYACCGDGCCAEGKVCARADADLAPTCVDANRSCSAGSGCLVDEQCIGGTCCSEDRICPRLDTTGTTEGRVCCPYGRYCDRSGGSDRAQCCPVGQRCATFRGTRIRR